MATESSRLPRKAQGPDLLHFGEDDPRIPFEEVASFDPSPDVSAFSYPGAARVQLRRPRQLSRRGEQKQRSSERCGGSPICRGQPRSLKNAGAYAQAKVEKKKKKKEGADDVGPPME
jgi:carboxymethylenebutenolidase